MYIIIDTETNKAKVTNFKQSVADIIGVHRNTVINRLRKENPSLINGFTVYEAEYIKGKVSKGNRDSWAERAIKMRKKLGYDE